MQSPECPRCKETDQVEEKLLMAGKRYPDEEFLRLVDREGSGFDDSLPANMINDEHFKEEFARQFISGFFCRRCQTAFVPDDYLKKF